MTDTARYIGLDLGGTNIKWSVVERSGPDGWHTLDRGQVPTDRAGEDEGIVAQLSALATEVRDGVTDGPVLTCGVAVPGLYVPETGVVTFLTNEPGDWTATPTGEPIAQATGLPTALINDARAFGLGELRFGAGKDVGSFVGLTLGTGIGGVVALDNQVLLGYNGQAGELGHQTIEPDGPWCGCGNRGCMESFCRADQVAAECGTADPREAIERARAGDQRCIDGLARIGRYLGIGLSNAVTVLTPERIILGGGWSSAGDLITEAIRLEMDKRVLIDSGDRVDIVIAELGTWAGAIGAAVHGAEQAARRGLIELPPEAEVHA